MKHAHKVILSFFLALVLAALLTMVPASFEVLNEILPLPLDVQGEVVWVGLFALLFLFLFDLMIVLIDGISRN